jgi:hypothetical protein
MKNITRTITQYVISAEQVTYKDGKMEVKELPVLKTPKKMSNNAIEKHFKKIAGEGIAVVVKKIEQEEKVYSMPVEKFMEIAKEQTEPEAVAEAQIETLEKTEK